MNGRITKEEALDLLKMRRDLTPFLRDHLGICDKAYLSWVRCPEEDKESVMSDLIAAIETEIDAGKTQRISRADLERARGESL